MPRKLLALMPEPWSVVELAGAALLGGGVWSVWGAPWACMLWGALLLVLAAARAWQLARAAERAGRQSE